jgi:hypothetical protein
MASRSSRQSGRVCLSQVIREVDGEPNTTLALGQGSLR